jgi:magnesium-transporting ATPase (P-type)
MIVSVFQKKIMTVVQALVTVSLLVVVAVLLVEGFVYGGFDNDVKVTILDALSILIASIPIALPLVLQGKNRFCLCIYLQIPTHPLL